LIVYLCGFSLINEIDAPVYSQCAGCIIVTDQLGHNLSCGVLIDLLIIEWV